jgi:hypothetical protein
MEVSGWLHAPAALPPEKEPWHPLDKKIDSNTPQIVIFPGDGTNV